MTDCKISVSSPSGKTSSSSAASKYVTKVTDPTHCLNELLPKHSSTRHSERRPHQRNTKYRTKLRERKLFYSYVNADYIKYA